MNTYRKAVGFAVGLVAVTAASALNAAIMQEGEGEAFVPFLGRKGYALFWLVSYLLTAAALGECVARKELRKAIVAPGALLATTTLAFVALYRMKNDATTAVFFGLCLAMEGVVLYVLTKNARYAFAGALINLFWYGLLTGEAILRCVL